VVEQSFRLDKSTAGDRFILRVLGTRSTDTDGASGAAFCSASSVKQPADSSLNENLHLEGLPLHGQRLGFNEPA
jgi:hypothetical protein